MVDPALFCRQIRSLRRRGYRIITLLEFAAYLDRGRPPGRTCVLTFDDGTVDNLTIVAPLLAELEIGATFFVCPGLLGEPHFAFPAPAAVRMMDADELRELAGLPFVEIGSHTCSHADLSLASAQEAYREMAESREALEGLLQRQIDTFAYPKCGYSSACPEAAHRAGYSAAVTCAGLGGWSRFELSRESIDSRDGGATFALKSRRLFWPLRESAPGRMARQAARPLRHRNGR